MPLYALGDLVPKTPASGNFWVAPNAAVIGKVTLLENAAVWFGATVRGDVEDIIIGENSNVQDNAVLHADPGAPLTVGANVTVGHHVMLHGCTIGDNALIGIKATVLNHAVIAPNTLVGAHALVTERKTFPGGTLVTGAPARVARELDAQQVQIIAGSAALYVGNWQRYRRDLAPSRLSSVD